MCIRDSGGGYGLAGQGEPFKGSYLLDAGLAYQFGTGKPATVVSPVASPPPAEAPANLDGPGDPNRVPLIIPPASPIAPTVPTSTLPPPLPPGGEGLSPGDRSCLLYTSVASAGSHGSLRENGALSSVTRFDPLNAGVGAALLRTPVGCGVKSLPIGLSHGVLRLSLIHI